MYLLLKGADFDLNAHPKAYRHGKMRASFPPKPQVGHLKVAMRPATHFSNLKLIPSGGRFWAGQVDGRYRYRFLGRSMSVGTAPPDFHAEVVSSGFSSVALRVMPLDARSYLEGPVARE